MLTCDERLFRANLTGHKILSSNHTFEQIREKISTSNLLSAKIPKLLLQSVNEIQAKFT